MHRAQVSWNSRRWTSLWRRPSGGFWAQCGVWVDPQVNEEGSSWSLKRAWPDASVQGRDRSKVRKAWKIKASCSLHHRLQYI